MRILPLALSLALVAPALDAQAPAPRCDSVFAAAETVVDSLRVSVEPDFRLGRVNVDGTKAFASLVATSLQLPHPLALPPVVDYAEAGQPGRGRSHGRFGQGLMGEVMLTLDSNGVAGAPLLVQSSLAAGVDSSLLAAVSEALRFGLAPEIVDAAKRVPGSALFVRLATTSGRSAATEIDRDGRRVSVGVAALRVPAVEVTSKPRAKRMARPAYPEVAAAIGNTGQTLLAFVIDRDGRVVPGTVGLWSHAQGGFAANSMDAVRKSEYEPAMVGKCPVATLVVQSFTYTTGPTSLWPVAAP